MLNVPLKMDRDRVNNQVFVNEMQRLNQRNFQSPAADPQWRENVNI